MAKHRTTKVVVKDMVKAMREMKASKRAKISNSFSAFIISRLQEEDQNGKTIELDRIANVLRLKPESIQQIRDAQDGFTVEQLLKIERAFGKSILSLLRTELEKNRLRVECEGLIELVKRGECLRETHVP